MTPILAVVFLLASPLAAAESLEIVAITDGSSPFSGSERIKQVTEGQANVSIHRLDAADALEAELGRDLPANEAQAREIVERRLDAMGEHELQARARQAYSGLIYAFKYRIDRYPAVVFNSDAVVYGETDLVQAWRRYHEWSQSN